MSTRLLPYCYHEVWSDNTVCYHKLWCVTINSGPLPWSVTMRYHECWSATTTCYHECWSVNHESSLFQYAVLSSCGDYNGRTVARRSPPQWETPSKSQPSWSSQPATAYHARIQGDSRVSGISPGVQKFLMKVGDVVRVPSGWVLNKVTNANYEFSKFSEEHFSNTPILSFPSGEALPNFRNFLTENKMSAENSWRCVTYRLFFKFSWAYFFSFWAFLFSKFLSTLWSQIWRVVLECAVYVVMALVWKAQHGSSLDWIHWCFVHDDLPLRWPRSDPESPHNLSYIFRKISTMDMRR